MQRTQLASRQTCALQGWSARATRLVLAIALPLTVALALALGLLGLLLYRRNYLKVRTTRGAAAYCRRAFGVPDRQTRQLCRNTAGLSLLRCRPWARCRAPVPITSTPRIQLGAVPWGQSSQPAHAILGQPTNTRAYHPLCNGGPILQWVVLYLAVLPPLLPALPPIPMQRWMPGGFR